MTWFDDNGAEADRREAADQLLRSFAGGKARACLVVDPLPDGEFDAMIESGVAIDPCTVRAVFVGRAPSLESVDSAVKSALCTFARSSYAFPETPWRRYYCRPEIIEVIVVFGAAALGALPHEERNVVLTGLFSHFCQVVRGGHRAVLWIDCDAHSPVVESFVRVASVALRSLRSEV